MRRSLGEVSQPVACIPIAIAAKLTRKEFGLTVPRTRIQISSASGELVVHVIFHLRPSAKRPLERDCSGYRAVSHLLREDLESLVRALATLL